MPAGPCTATTRYVMLPSLFVGNFLDEVTRMQDLWRALAISGTILAAVVIFIVVISAVTVRRGEASMSESGKQNSGGRH